MEAALAGVSKIVLNEWGSNTACQIIIITDGNAGIGPGSLKDSLATIHQRNINNVFPVPFSFPTKIHVAALTQSNDPCLMKSKPLYQKLIDINGHGGSIFVPDQLNDSGVTNLFKKLADEMYACFKGTLKCGNLESKIILSPAPIPYTKISDFDCQTYNVKDILEICGFMSVTDIGSPMSVSRHLILPAAASSVTSLNITTNPTSNSATSSSNPSTPIKSDSSDLVNCEQEGDISDEGKVPSFCVLLHGALKVENMAALVQVNENWYGFVYTWADSKKKSNLMLTLLVPGTDSVPWLGNLTYLHSAEGITSECWVNFPIKSTEKRSYSQNSVVWIRQAGLQSDIQKILRHARKLPEKTQQFYKELNRLRKAAIQLGFLELLTGLAYIFEQECTQLPGSAHPDCALQLTHAADALRKSQNRDFKHVIVPMQTNYNTQ